MTITDLQGYREKLMGKETTPITIELSGEERKILTQIVEQVRDRYQRIINNANKTTLKRPQAKLNQIARIDYLMNLINIKNKLDNE
jgi:hypothetical protein